MNYQNSHKISSHGKIIVAAFLLLISCATTTNAIGKGTDGVANAEGFKILDIFDTAIRHFVEQLAEPELTDSSGSDQQLNLTYKNAALILKEIDEKVVYKIISAERKDRRIEMGFFGTLDQMSNGRHIHNQQQMQWNSDHQRFLESMGAEELKKANAELFHRLLTFAIRMGFHIGQTALDAAVHVNEPKLELLKFVRAQNAFEKMYSTDLNLREEHSPQIWVENKSRMSPSTVLKLDFNPPAESWNKYAIDHNLTTIKWLLLHSVDLTFEDWLSLVATIWHTRINGIIDTSGANKVENLLEQLLAGWTRNTETETHTTFIVKPLVYCALNNFAFNLVEHLDGVEKIQLYFAKYKKVHKLYKERSKISAEHYKTECTHEKLLENGEKDIELYMLSTEPFMHFEDAIPYNELKSDEEINRDKAKQVLKLTLYKWHKKFVDCKITQDPTTDKLILTGKNIGTAGTQVTASTQCDLENISKELEAIERNNKLNIQDAFQVQKLAKQWLIFISYFHELETLKTDLQAANKKIEEERNKSKQFPRHFFTSDKNFAHEKRKTINVVVSEMEDQFVTLKMDLLSSLNEMVEECGGWADNWAQVDDIDMAQH